MYDIVGQPAFALADSLTDAEVLVTLDMLLKRMAEHHLFLSILAPDDYNDRTIYRFLTEELF